jgi:hypothetical protein
MAHQNRFNNNRKRPPHADRVAAAERPAFFIPPAKQPTAYGKAFIILEDAKKQTFEYRSGAWVPYSMTIAQCRAEGEVKELAQKMNKMTRFEVRLPLSHAE